MQTVEFKLPYDEAPGKIGQALKNIDADVSMGISLEVVSKPHLSPNGGVAGLR